MSAPAARVGDMTTHGTPLSPGPGCVTVLIQGQPAWRTGDSHVCPLTNGTRPHLGGTVAAGSSTVFIGGQSAAREGDIVVEAGGPNGIAGGSTTVFIG
jgi:uncharacterized Zn-binding protein involved in type VI secretion